MVTLNKSKQSVEIVFSIRNIKPDLTFNGVPVARESFTKHLGFYLHEKLPFQNISRKH